MKKEQQHQNSRARTSLEIIAVATILSMIVSHATCSAVSDAVQARTCKGELENANKSMKKWAENMEKMVNESELPAPIRENIHNEANKILDSIELFREQTKTQKPAMLAGDLVAVRKRFNKMALDVYLNTFDMRWPQNSLQVGVTVERVQQACLDKDTIQTLEAPSNPLDSQ